MVYRESNSPREYLSSNFAGILTAPAAAAFCSTFIGFCPVGVPASAISIPELAFAHAVYL
jgi:hypothetical protein